MTFDEFGDIVSAGLVKSMTVYADRTKNLVYWPEYNQEVALELAEGNTFVKVVIFLN